MADRADGGIETECSTHRDLDGGVACRVESVELEQTRRRTVRRSTVIATGKYNHLQPLLPCRRAIANGQYARNGLVEPPGVQRRTDPAVVEAQFGGLLPGERTVLRGRKLGNRTSCGVDHGAHRTRGVSHRRAAGAASDEL
jgi:hypothetical protein